MSLPIEAPQATVALDDCGHNPAVHSHRNSAIPVAGTDPSFTSSWAPGVVSAFGHDAELDPAIDGLLRGLWDTGRAAWPGFEIAPLTWGSHLAQAARASDPSALADLPGLHAEDLYLACGCTLAIPQAVAAFDRLYLVQLPVLLGHMHLSASFIDEIGQVLREKLLVGTGERPARIGRYAGQGPLLGWLRVVAIRTALNLGDSQDEKNLRDSAAADALVAAQNPERELIVGQQRKELLEILREAFCTLPTQQRKAMRMHLCEGLTGDEIASQLSVHRSTVVRWLSAARLSLLQEIERLFRRRLDLSPAEVQSLVAGTRSHLDLRLSLLFNSAPDGEAVP